MIVPQTLKVSTMPMRHKLVKLIAPALYYDCDNGARPLAVYLRKKYQGTPLIGVEIGVWKGKHALEVLSYLNMHRLYLVDSYVGFTEDHFVCTQQEADQNYSNAVKLFSNKPNTTLMRRDSLKAATGFVDNSLDFAYIDATHTYEGVKADIAAWFPKVKPGGVLGGHDFKDTFQSVVRAVSEFVYNIHGRLYFSGNDWWVLKGEYFEGLFR